jgi:hypothetical protein
VIDPSALPMVLGVLTGWLDPPGAGGGRVPHRREPTPAAPTRDSTTASDR